MSEVDYLSFLRFLKTVEAFFYDLVRKINACSQQKLGFQISETLIWQSYWAGSGRFLMDIHSFMESIWTDHQNDSEVWFRKINRKKNHTVWDAEPQQSDFGQRMRFFLMIPWAYSLAIMGCSALYQQSDNANAATLGERVRRLRMVCLACLLCKMPKSVLVHWPRPLMDPIKVCFDFLSRVWMVV